MVETTFIYALTEPGTRTIRYLGKAVKPKRRCVRHIHDAKKGEAWHVSRWIRKLLRVGQRPDVHILCEVPHNDWERFERAFIALGRQAGLDLTNGTDGGDGHLGLCGGKHPMFGKKHSREACAKMSASHKGRTPSQEHRKNLSVANTGKKPSPEALINMRAGQIRRRKNATAAKLNFTNE